MICRAVAELSALYEQIIMWGRYTKRVTLGESVDFSNTFAELLIVIPGSRDSERVTGTIVLVSGA